MHVYNGVHATARHHVNDIGDALQPHWVDCPVGGLGSEVVRPGHGNTDALEAGSFGVVKGTANDRRVVPVALGLHGIERVANVPAWVQLRKEGTSRHGREF